MSKANWCINSPTSFNNIPSPLSTNTSFYLYHATCAVSLHLSTLFYFWSIFIARAAFLTSESIDKNLLGPPSSCNYLTFHSAPFEFECMVEAADFVVYYISWGVSPEGLQSFWQGALWWRLVKSKHGLSISLWYQERELFFVPSVVLPPRLSMLKFDCSVWSQVMLSM